MAHVHGVGDPSPSTANSQMEGVGLRAMEDSIRNFVVAADPKSANVVPLRNGNIVLSNAEVDAFRSDYGTEKSFRADYAGALRQTVAVLARIQLELREYGNKQNSACLWKPHADALAFLISAANSLQEHCGAVVSVAQQRGLGEKVTAIRRWFRRDRSSRAILAGVPRGG